MQFPNVPRLFKVDSGSAGSSFQLPKHVDILQLSLGNTFSNLSRSELRTRKSGAPSLPRLWLQSQLLKSLAAQPPPSAR